MSSTPVKTPNWTFCAVMICLQAMFIFDVHQQGMQSKIKLFGRPQNAVCELKPQIRTAGLVVFILRCLLTTKLFIGRISLSRLHAQASNWSIHCCVWKDLLLIGRQNRGGGIRSVQQQGTNYIVFSMQAIKYTIQVFRSTSMRRAVGSLGYK